MKKDFSCGITGELYKQVWDINGIIQAALTPVRSV